MRTWLAVTAAVFALFIVTLHGQGLGTFTVYAAGTNCTTTGACAVFNSMPQGSMGIQVSGTFTATLLFEVTTDGQTWVQGGVVNPATGALINSTSTPGLWFITNVGYQGVRVRASALSSGYANITGAKGYATLPGTGGSGAGYTNLVQDSPTTLGVRDPLNPNTPQEFRVYKSYTDVNNFNALRIVYDPNAPYYGGTGAILISTLAFAGGVPVNNGLDYLTLQAKNITIKESNNNNTLSVNNGGVYIPNPVLMPTVDGGYRSTIQQAGHGAVCWNTAGSAVASTAGLCVSQSDGGVMTLWTGFPAGTPGNATWQAGDPGYAQPTCDVGHRGEYWHSFGAAGTKDAITICAKDATNAYAWRVVY